MKKSIKIIALLLALAFIASCFAGCGGGNGSKEKTDGGTASDEKVELILGHIQSEEDVWHKASEVFKKEVEEKSNGNITVKIYANSTLGGDRDMVEGMQSGTVDIALVAGVLGNFEPSIQLLEIPYLFHDKDEYDKIIDGEVGQEIKDRVLEKTDIRILNFWDRGPRQVTSNKPINTVEDIKGLKIRIPEINAMKVVWEAMGASPITMAWNEVYTALEQGVVEAQENPIPFIYSGGIHEVQKYIAITNHKYEYVTFPIAETKWKSLTEEQQKIVQDAAEAATKWQDEEVIRITENLTKEIEESGVTITHPDIQTFIKSAEKAGVDYGMKQDEELFTKILKELGRQ